MAYLDLDGFKLLSVMPDEHVDQLESTWPGFLAAQLDAQSVWIESRLRKRYKRELFTAEPLTKLLGLWLSRIVTAVAYSRRGWDPSGVDVDAIVTDGEAARAEVLEAANGENGLFELALADSEGATAPMKQATRAYSEQSPYVGFSRQARIGRDEDENGEGSCV